ncbi:hypothetical protein EA187_19565 [Lujinxingia sediminis]|uniref:YprB ribonuclease H-like domain-containing protein n=1 Tax=Lujinxingia sediminis TaxID=2480984 RepID=A0ABY0CMV2_9DELT|nr:ribonuclease H-like domain-containing protein [Lujinxingia sediminis]RVU40981.1 hypothetical protein EA187_19565 [Lujinxingia sediminis]
MSSRFRNRLERLHGAHQRGRESTSGPSGVFEAGAPGEGEVHQVKGESSPDTGGFDDSGERAEGPSGSIVRKASSTRASRGVASARHRSSGGARRSRRQSSSGGARPAASTQGAASAQRKDRYNQNTPNEKNWGQWGAENQGEFWLLREEVPPGEVHGRFEVGACREIDHRLISKVDPGCPGVRPEGLLYMDTETSGLGQGALAFCVGIGFWAGERFVVEQLLLDGSDAAGERAMLAYFANMLRERHLLVTFNGRRFDVPLLARRYARHQLSDPFGGRQHLDLLPTARRHFVGRKRYKLSSLEEDILDFHRVDDVPGREIPALWERFVAGEVVPKMGGMLEHNRHDIVSMAALLAAQIEAVGGVSIREASANAARRRSASGAVRAGERESETGGGDFGRASSGGSKVSEVASRLERTYRLRSSFSESSGRSSEGGGLSAERPNGRMNAGDGTTVGRTSARHDGADRAGEGRPSSARSVDEDRDPGSGEGEDPNVKERVRSLRAAARAMIDAQLFHQAAPTLFELVALAPDDRFGLQMLARYYRQAGEAQLAGVMEARFRSAGGG